MRAGYPLQVLVWRGAHSGLSTSIPCRQCYLYKLQLSDPDISEAYRVAVILQLQ